MLNKYKLRNTKTNLVSYKSINVKVLLYKDSSTPKLLCPKDLLVFKHMVLVIINFACNFYMYISRVTRYLVNMK